MYNNKLVRAYQMAPSYIPNSLAKKPLKQRSSLGPVDREFANVETEGGETVYLPDKQGLPAHYRIHGPRHHEGGVPMSIPPDSFVYSDTASMRIKDPELQAEFGMPVSKKGYTPAEIAKKYDINKFRKILVDPMSDQIQINTAEQVIANYQLKLAKLALIQESMKGFPAGIPLVAMPYLAKYQLDPKMFLPIQVDENQQQQPEQPEGQPQARYGGSLRQFRGGGQNTTIPEQLRQFPTTSESNIRTRRELRRLERQRRGQILDQILMQVLSGQVNQKQNKPVFTGDVYYREDEAGNSYFVDENGLRVDAADDMIYGPNNQPTVNNKRIIVKNGKRYQVEVKEKKSNIDPAKIKPKDQATQPGDIYQETDGKYYVVREYDKNKPIHSTKSGNKYSGDYEADKVRALALLEQLEKDGHAVFHDKPYMVGSKTRNPGWEIRSSSKNAISTGDKEFLTDFLSYSKTNGLADPEKNPKYNVSLQSAGNSGFYGYTTPDFYEYRFWKAKNPNKTAKDWDDLDKTDKKAKIENRRDMLYSLGFDTTDPHIKNNLEKPDALYTTDFVSGKKKVKTNRAIKDADGNQYTEMGLAPAVESYFSGSEWRPLAQEDQKLGLDHADAFTFERKTEELPKEGDETVETEIAEAPQYKSGDDYAPWWIQDVIRTTGAAIDYLSLKKYMPSKFQYSPYIPEPTFYDPTREIAATQETANIATDLIAGAGNKGAATYSARAAAIQGTAAKNIADILGRYNTQNVGVANEFEYKKADIMNQAQLLNLEASQKYVDQVNLTNQNYDNAKREARAQLRSAYIDAITNRAQAQVLNTLYPNYKVNPASGGTLDFYKGDELTGVESPSSLQADQLVSWMDRNDRFTLDDAVKIWSATTKGSTQPVDSRKDYYDAYMSSMPTAINPMAYAGYMAGQEQQKKGGPKLPFAYTVGY